MRKHKGRGEPSNYINPLSFLHTYTTEDHEREYLHCPKTKQIGILFYGPDNLGRCDLCGDILR